MLAAVAGRIVFTFFGVLFLVGAWFSTFTRDAAEYQSASELASNIGIGLMIGAAAFGAAERRQERRVQWQPQPPVQQWPAQAQGPWQPSGPAAQQPPAYPQTPVQ